MTERMVIVTGTYRFGVTWCGNQSYAYAPAGSRSMELIPAVKVHGAETLLPAHCVKVGAST
jgi:hypothetical protein